MAGSPYEARHRLILLFMCHLMAVTGEMVMTERGESGDVEARAMRQKTEVVLMTLDPSMEHVLDDQNTSNQTQSCIRRDSTGCPWPFTPNADVTPLFWSFVNVTCRPGFQFESGPPLWTITQCVNNNRWSPVPKSCIRISCPPLQSFTDASLNTTRVSYGTRVNVSCETGKQLMTSSSNWIVTECQADGTWSTNPSNCLSAAPGTPTVAHSLHGKNSVTAMDLFNGELFVVRPSEKYVSVYDMFTLESKRQISIPGVSTLAGLAVSSADKCIYVSDYTFYRVHRIDLSNNIVTGWNVPFTPYGLSVTNNGNVLVGTYSASKIIEYTSTGTLVREITDGNFLYQAVERISDGTLLVLRTHPIHSIAQMTREGSRVIRSIAGMHNPRALAVDSEGSIFVVDHSNNRIQLVDPSLSIARTLPLPHGVTLNHPHALCYDESRGRLYVGEYTGQFRVLAFDNVTNMF